MPTPRYLNGFENRVFAVGGATTDGLWSALTLTAITPASEGTVVRGAGVRSLKLPVPTATSQASMRIVIPSQSRLAVRFYFRKSGNPSQANCHIFSVASASTFFTLTLQTDGSLQARTSGGTSPTNGTASAVLNNDQWYCIDFVIDASTTSWVGRLWVDGAQAATDATVTGAAAGAFVNADFGKVQSGSNTAAFDMYLDDLIVGTASGITDKFGETDGIVGLLPDSDGTHSFTSGAFTDAAAANISPTGTPNPAWDNVDSGDLTQTAERISQPVAGSGIYCEIAFGTVTLPVAAPVAVQAEVALNSSGASAFTGASTRARNGAVETVIFTGDWSTATKWYKRALVAVANQSELDGLKMRLGYCTAQPDTPYWEALMYEVDIGQSSGTPISDDDADLTTDDVASVSATIPAAETDTGDDAASLAVGLAAGEAGSSIESAFYSYALTAADSGSSVESASISVPVSASDAGVGSDTQTLVARATSTDNASGSETSSYTYALSTADTGAGVNTESVAVPGVAISGSDAGSGADTATVVFIVAAADSGISNESTSLMAALLSGQSNGATTETVVAGVLIPTTDLGAGTDLGTNTKTVLSTGETGTSIDVGSISGGAMSINSGETGIGSEAISTMTKRFADAASGADAPALAYRMTVPDVGVGTDATLAAIIRILGEDSCSSAEAATILATILGIDGGLGVDDGTAHERITELMEEIRTGRIVVLTNGNIDQGDRGKVIA